MNLFYRFFILIFLLMAGCATHREHSLSVPISAACQKQYLIDSLKKTGVQIIQVGDELRLILPNQRFFIKNTPNLQATSYRSLDEIITLLNQKKNIGINVLAYTPSFEDLKPNISLAQQQAQTIVDYFLQQGIKSRLIAATVWKGVSVRQREGSSAFNDDGPRIFSVEIRTRLLQPEDSQ